MAWSRAVALAAGILMATGCSESPSPEPTPAPEPPTAAEMSSCLEDRGIMVRERRVPSYESASAELIVGEKRRAGVRVGLGVLFFATEADVRQALVTARILADPVEVIGRVMIVPAGPGFADAERALVECLGVEPATP